MHRLIILLLLALLTPLSAQVERAPEFEDLFNRTQGWTGADGTYSVPYNGRVMWLFSDTFFGRVEDGRRVDTKMLNNSMILQDGDDLDFVKAPLFTDPTSEGWFWLMDAVSDGTKSEILLAHIVKDPGSWLSFKQDGCWYASFRMDERAGKVVVNEYKEVPHFGSREKELLTWGTAIYQNSTWVYIFGTHDEGLKRSLVVARAPKGQLGNFGTWRFWDGKSWSRDKWSCENLFAGASNESGVYATEDGGFFYVGSHKELKSGKVVGRYSPSVTGPWQAEMEIYLAPEMGGNIISYNAKSHPELSRDGRLLISYNVNTTDIPEVFEVADIYRPRFIWWTPPSAGWLPAR